MAADADGGHQFAVCHHRRMHRPHSMGGISSELLLYAPKQIGVAIIASSSQLLPLARQAPGFQAEPFLRCAAHNGRTISPAVLCIRMMPFSDPFAANEACTLTIKLPL